MYFWKRFSIAFLLFFLPLFSQNPYYKGINLCTGEVELLTEDGVVESGFPISITRGTYFLKKSFAEAPLYKALEKVGLFPYLKLYLHKNSEGYYARIIENSGTTLYEDVAHPKNAIEMRRNFAQHRNYHASTNYREDRANDKLTFHRNDKDAILQFADGSQRFYEKHCKPTTWKDSAAGYYRNLGYEYRLVKEISPNGNTTKYEYDGESSVCIKKISHTGAVVSWAHITLEKYPGNCIKVETSDHQVFQYYLTALGRDKLPQNLLRLEKTGCKPKHFFFVRSPITKDFYPSNLFVEGEELCLTYYFDHHLKGVKVQTLCKQNTPLATFSYKEGVTTLHNFRGSSKQYSHQNGRITQIQTFDKEHVPYSLESFEWEGPKLLSHSFFDRYNNTIFTKQFVYDEYGNLIRKNWSNDQESYTKSFVYDSSHRLVKENDNEVITTYKYLEETLLPTHKISPDLEETFQYDDNHLLVASRWYFDQVERTKTYVRDTRTLLITKSNEGALPTFFTYNDACQIVEERTGNKSISFHYDSGRRLIEKRFPLGGVTSYEYDEDGTLKAKKEVGKARMEFHFDKEKRTKTTLCSQKVTKESFDLEGKVVEKINEYGASTSFVYDEFGRLTKKTFPFVEIQGVLYHPQWLYEYDELGNVVKEISPSGQQTSKTYNLLGKPTKIELPNGSYTTHKYDHFGNVLTSSLEDSTKITYKYDSLGRCIEKTLGSTCETWEYKGLQLINYTDKRGLITKYYYDEHGRIEAMDCAGRIKLFAYDENGHCFHKEEGELVETRVHDLEGKVIASSQGEFEHIKHEYNDENQKIRTLTSTSQGEAEDLYSYDEEGRLHIHTNPLGEETRYEYELQKEAISYPSGKRIEKELDHRGRVIIEKLLLPDGSKNITYTFYGIDGNISKQTKNNGAVELLYDPSGLLVEKIEKGQKTLFAYDKKGRCIEKTLPNKTSLLYQYDREDRVKSIESSDNSISYQYFYKGQDLIQIKDISNNKSIYFTYSKFGELETETGVHGLCISWSYDTFGRKKALHLPDGSSILYQYKKNCLVAISRKNTKSNKIYSHEYSEFDQLKQVMQEILPLGLGTTSTEHDILQRPTKVCSPFHKIEVCFDKEQRSKQESTLFVPSPSKEEDATLEKTIANKHFDALGRLHLVEYEDGTFASFTYDALDRLVSKQTKTGTSYFLHDGNTEIAKVKEDGEIKRLKVYGLDEHGKRGAAIAIELEGEVLVPLYDLQGNMVALVDNHGHVEEISSYIHSIENF